MDKKEEQLHTAHPEVAQPIGLPMLDNTELGKNLDMKDLKPHPAHAIKTQLQVSLGEVQLTVGELASLKENQVLALGTRFDEEVDLSLDGQVVARGLLVALDGHFAIQITQLPLPLTL